MSKNYGEATKKNVSTWKRVGTYCTNSTMTSIKLHSLFFKNQELSSKYHKVLFKTIWQDFKMVTAENILLRDLRTSWKKRNSWDNADTTRLNTGFHKTTHEFNHEIGFRFMIEDQPSIVIYRPSLPIFSLLNSAEYNRVQHKILVGTYDK